MLLNTSLLRERFIINEENSKSKPKVALGNRLLLPLNNGEGTIQERFVIRSQTMHMALRMAAFISNEFYKRGPILNRQVPLKWDDIWYDMTNEYERIYNPSLWCCIYHNGRPIFKFGQYHSFLDVIEQCDIKNRSEYDRAVYLAEDIFKDAGKIVDITHQVNIGVVIGAMDKRIRCGLILRAPSHTSTFNFMIEEHDDVPTPLLPHHGLELASYYLEGIQLAVLIGIAEHNKKNNIQSSSKVSIPIKSAYNRIGRLTQSIIAYENTYKIRYRPEKPDFKLILEEAQALNWGTT